MTDDHQVWSDWLAGKGYRDAPLRRLPNRVLRASLPGGAFFGGRMEWWRLGSFETRKHSFLQVWCEDEEARRTAVLERTATRIRGRTIQNSDEIGAILTEQAALLDVATPSVDEVRSNRSEEPA
ncbi:hypothetical protein [Actinoplanes sp. NBRC 103695]|uniref:hypothetical protein n=1 Tax=Actinoplanes sp. NBRC 103695 TaxID=3032202 RepID=UPI0024A56981|nr:hypothetical protein [Actinoplanes sp. NBRC 103695]GLZ02448.1 hypothetical protein Acsp02_96990 [Actinoplanes sp. NBRC 103695]